MEAPIDRLNDDTLLAILSHLKKQDLCALSLTSKHFHAISSPRLWTVISTKRASYVSWLHGNIGTNARYVREMTINVDEKAPMLPDVLFATKNIHFFVIYLAGLCDLRTFVCGMVEDEMLPTIQGISHNLTNLGLSYQYKNFSDHLTPLISLIRSFPRLHDLILHYIQQANTIDIANHPPFPSIQRLILTEVTEPATDLVCLCPNVSALKICLFSTFGKGLNKFDESRPKWRLSSIPQVVLSVPCTEGRDSTVSFLERWAFRATHARLPMLWHFTADGISFTEGEAASRLTRVLDVLKPHSLHLEISARGRDKRLSDTDRTGTLWQEVAAAAPHLRALVLHVQSFDDGERPRELWTPPDALVAELARLPLFGVRLNADTQLLKCKADADHRQRIRALAAFPEKLAAASPTLRVVGVSDGWRKLEGMRSERWWRVERGDGDGGSRSLVELWREDGGRALELVLNEAFCVSDLDEIYLGKCRYVRSHHDVLFDVHRLNEDVLLAVLSYLPGNNAVQLAYEGIKAVSDILGTAKNLRQLSLSTVIRKGWMEYPSIVHALTQMKNLRALYYSPICLDDVLPMIQSIPSPNLVHLSLSYDFNNHDFPPLLSVLKSFPKLPTLALNSFLPGPTLLDTTQTSFPSIRHLSLTDVSVAATDILYLCPNLGTIEFSPNDEQRSMQGHTDPRPRWPKVSRLTVDIGRATRWGGDADAPNAEPQIVVVELFERRASPVPHLELSCEWELTRNGVAAVDADTSRRLMCLLAALQPRALTLPVHAGFNQSPDKRLDGWMWTEVAGVLPHLRALTLRHIYPNEWVPPDTLPAALAQLPLHCLFIDASPPEIDRFNRAPYRELERVKVLGALPAKLLAALTKIRVLGIKGIAALPSSSLNSNEKRWLTEVDEWRKQHGERNTRWWRVDGVGEERKLVELWREYGEQAQRIIEDSETYRVADLDAIYLDRCRYEP
ncbi:uncharacterized protein BXZ73DRAFT_110146 [Epithele typhae]|uniref:uncharacterized protein n=1 Tax=Epithele typhae TaxID=378194 RepID=UPI002007C46B|nr:uncharacterized protein BXZ73DRAFT_110146 [Epithele typhae]KAH9907681.1 hypothetical protein BXZ73DRAFT_110146 [Epithele typhae]